MQLTIVSFGYKFKIPIEADYVFDVRCIPNPYWQISLRALNGTDPEIGQFLQKQPQTNLLLNDIKRFLDTWIPQFISDDRTQMTIAFGCTGGQHRSVYIAEKMAEHFRQQYQDIDIHHREL